MLNIIDFRPGAKTRAGIIATLKIIVCISLIIVFVDLLKLLPIFKNASLPLLISISNIFLLILIRAIDYTTIIGIDGLEEYWRKNKGKHCSVLLHGKNVTPAEKDNVLVKFSNLKLSSINSPFIKTDFLITDSQGLIKSFKNEIAILIWLNIALTAILVLGTDDLPDFIVPNAKWPTDALNLVNAYRAKVVLISSVAGFLFQMCFTLRVPFLLDVRNKVHLSELQKRTS